MKIVFIGPFGLQPKATMSIRAAPLAKALAGRGHTVTVLIPPWDDPERSGQVWAEDGVQIVNVVLPGGLLRLPLLFHIVLTRTLVAQALALQPDVIHLFKPKAYAGLVHLVMWWLRRLTVLAVRLVVDEDDWEQAWNEMSAYSPWQRKFFVWQERWGLRHADALTVASRELERLVTRNFGRNSADIFYVPNGYHTSPTAVEPGQTGQPGNDNQTRPNPPVDDNAPTILLYTRFVEFRLDRIVSLVGLVAGHMPQARWLIVGAGLKGEEKSLAAKLAQARLSEYVHFAGWVPGDQLAAYFAAADVAVYPYDNTLLNRTKCSVKLTSLLAAGLPVVADAVGQNCEYIESGVSGMLVPAENDPAFAAAVVKLLQQADMRERFGQVAAHYVQEKFRWSSLAQIAEKAYQQS